MKAVNRKADYPGTVQDVARWKRIYENVFFGQNAKFKGNSSLFKLLMAYISVHSNVLLCQLYHLGLFIIVKLIIIFRRKNTIT